MNAEYWRIKDDRRLSAGEVISSGWRDKDAANAAAKRLSLKYKAMVGRFETIESDYPIEDPRYEPFSSARWCVVVIDEAQS